MPKLTPSARHNALESSSGSNELNGARWLKTYETVEIQGQQIAGGLFYLGHSLPRLDGPSNDNCLVDPNLAVSRTRADTSGHDMPYWPSYSTITPWSRKSYLDWLGGTRADPASYVGYAFLNFYGLERRLFLDRECDDADAVLAEVTRLLRVFAWSKSFRHYGGAFLQAYERLTAVPCGSLRIVAPRNHTNATRANGTAARRYRRWGSSEALYVAASGTFELQPAQAASDARQQDLFEDSKLAIERPYAGDERPVVIIRAPSPRLPSASWVTSVPSYHTPIDWNKLTDIRRESRNSASLLDAIFDDGRDTGPPERPQLPTRAQEDTSVLDDRHRAFLRGLMMKPEWTRPDFDGLAKRFGLMPSAAKETINEWTYERFDELILCGEDPVLVARLVVPEGELGAAA